jgi:hypothetical protein
MDKNRLFSSSTVFLRNLNFAEPSAWFSGGTSVSKGFPSMSWIAQLGIS